MYLHDVETQNSKCDLYVKQSKSLLQKHIQIAKPETHDFNQDKPV